MRSPTVLSEKREREEEGSGSESNEEGKRRSSEQPSNILKNLQSSRGENEKKKIHEDTA